ncbi:hypothetical protein V6N13_088905 [Hibiscus sabdariffa]|uniref:Uncharacterized protein n=1 Tax=Hibiscus sabdariffa TaxID=183260 RepID=A0ABR2G0S6_9ROSI
MGLGSNLLDKGTLMVDGQPFHVFNNPLQFSGNNDGPICVGSSMMDVQMGLDTEDNPIEHLDKRSRKNFDSDGLIPPHEPSVLFEKNVLVDLTDQARREP